MIRLVPAPEVTERWPEFLPWIRRGLLQTAEMTSAAQVQAGLENGILQMWADLAAPVVAVTTISDYPALRVLSVVLLAGRGMSRWLAPLEHELEVFGRGQGCAALEALVRPGLAGARHRPSRAKLKGWRAEKTLMRRWIGDP